MHHGPWLGLPTTAISIDSYLGTGEVLVSGVINQSRCENIRGTMGHLTFCRIDPDNVFVE